MRFYDDPATMTVVIINGKGDTIKLEYHEWRFLRDHFIGVYESEHAEQNTTGSFRT